MRFISALIVMTVLYLSVQTTAPLKSQDDRLSPQEQRGKEIYFGEESSKTPIKAIYGSPPVDLPATLAGCVSCHGRDGRGKPESEVPPKDITWDVLMRASSPDSQGKVRPAYTERLLVRAVCMGIDPGGNELQVTMPRFQLSREDMSALSAYLKRLGSIENREQ
jgi:hypothetical protein